MTSAPNRLQRLNGNSITINPISEAAGSSCGFGVLKSMVCRIDKELMRFQAEDWLHADAGCKETGLHFTREKVVRNSKSSGIFRYLCNDKKGIIVL